MAGAVAAIWVTLDASFLEYPGWLAAQKADFIIGPIGVGLYWRQRRPQNHLGLLLIALGLVGLMYILASTTDPTLFGIGLLAEIPIYVITSIIILAFPSGRLDKASKWLIVGLIIPAVVVSAVGILAAPDAGPGFSISGCLAQCPANGVAIWPSPSWTPQLNDVYGGLLIALPLATAGMLVWRYLTGTPPRRRALAIGGPIALVFLLTQASYRTLFFIAPNGLAATAHPVQSGLQWALAVTRSLVWYGFLFALIAAELYAGRVLRRLIHSSLGRPSFRELEEEVRSALGDPGLRLGFWRDRSDGWVDAEGAPLEPPRPDQTSSEIDRDGHPVVAIIHDQQLREDPELVRAAGAVAVLERENAELDEAWKDALSELLDSRARLVQVGDRERRKLERDLHDGAQHLVLAALVRLSTANALASDSPELRDLLDRAEQDLDEAIGELRELAHGIFPTVLADRGLAGSLRTLALRFPGRVSLSEVIERRFAPEIEAALYYCCLEATQNVTKHAGPDARTSIRVYLDGRELRLEVRDDGAGFDLSAPLQGIGLQSMRDRLGAVGGHAEVASRPGAGTVVTAAVSVDHLGAQADPR